MDKEFLIALDEFREREIYARVIALTFQEDPVELIEGIVTGGSINIDGASALRRTCNLNLVAKDININDFYWGVKSKFKLEIGLKNTVDTERYPDIIWFPQGTYVITTFNMSRGASNCTISISGKDKMCLLNGDLGGNLTASIDFGVEEFLDKRTNTTTFVKIPIEKILRESLHAYAGEPYHNIILNDLDEAAVELLEYRGDTPLYLLRDVLEDEFNNFTDDGSIQVRKATVTEIETGKVDTTIASGYFNLEHLVENDGYYDSRVELAPEAQANKATQLVFKDSPRAIYTVAKLEYGQTAGYRSTELTYAGDLISNIGEALTSIYDKIKNMLGNYEYFYDVDGRFIFQRKKIYTYNPWNGIVGIGDDEYVDTAAQSSAITYKFEGNRLITSFQNSPNLANLKNDYSIWGQRESVSGEKVPIHYRYAIDIKPTHYISLNITEEDIKDYNSEYGDIAPLTTQTSKRYDIDTYDWREIIYQMANDYYKYNQLDCYAARLAEANRWYDEENGLHRGEEPQYQFGVTGYEQYYIDLSGFWRQLYNSNPEPDYLDFYQKGDEDTFEYKDSEEQTLPLYICGKYETANPLTQDFNDIYALMPIVYTNEKEEQVARTELHPWIEAIQLPEYLDKNAYNTIGEGTDIELDAESKYFYYLTKDSEENRIYKPICWSTKLQFDRKEIYVYEDGDFIPLIQSTFAYRDNYKLFYFNSDKKYYNVLEQPLEIKNLYYQNEKYYRFLYNTPLDHAGVPIDKSAAVKVKINYFTEQYNYIIDNEEYMYWTTDLINNPSQLNFWFDFLDADSELGQFSVPAVGDRTKAVNDNTVTAIYFRQVPNLIFTTYAEYQNSDIKDKTGYTPVFVNGNLESMFNISAQGKSAQDKLDELLYNHSYCIENVTIQSVPIYYLQPNTRIFVRDDESKINGEYIVSKISIPLQYNGLMSITASKAPERIY